MGRRLFDALPEVGARLARAPHVLMCLDFDGTLSHIVADPANATLSPTIRATLQLLAARENISLAIISGRERTDLLERVAIPDLIYAGNHGLEISGPGFIFIEPTAMAHRAALQELAGNLTARLQPVAGALVEDKGLTLTIHFRQVAGDQYEEVRRIVHAALASASHPFFLTTGDKVYEIRPRVYWDKGATVEWIKQRVGEEELLTVYFGDDATDEDAFTALQGEITVKVGESAESAAQFQVEGPAEVERFLRWLANRPR